MAEMIQPKVCAVCGQVLDRNAVGAWMHARELANKSDHIAVPVDYETVPVVTRCDFCYRVVELRDLWTQPAKDFVVPLINHTSAGGWACCPTCAGLALAHDWDGMIERHLNSPESETPDSPLYRKFIKRLYETLEENITEPARLWRAGDEKVKA